MATSGKVFCNASMISPVHGVPIGPVGAAAAGFSPCGLASAAGFAAGAAAGGDGGGVAGFAAGASGTFAAGVSSDWGGWGGFSSGILLIGLLIPDRDLRASRKQRGTLDY